MLRESTRPLPDGRDEFGLLVPHMGAQLDDPGIIQSHLDKGGSPDYVHDGNFSDLPLLHLACMNGHVRIASMLLDAGANVNLKADNGLLPLMIAIGETKPPATLIDLLLERGAHPDGLLEPYSGKGFNPLLRAAVLNHRKTIAALLEKGALATIATDNGMTPLMCNCQYADVETFRMLLFYSNVEQKDHENSTIFDYIERLLPTPRLDDFRNIALRLIREHELKLKVGEACPGRGLQL